MSDCKAVATPVEANLKLVKSNEERKLVDPGYIEVWSVLSYSLANKLVQIFYTLLINSQDSLINLTNHIGKLQSPY